MALLAALVGLAGPAGAAPAWTPFEAGFDRDETIRRSGTFALRCTNAAPTERRGGLLVVALNQKRATPVLVTGWSRAREVSGPANADYSVYVDLDYDDGSHGYGFASAFDAGTHDWQRRRVTITPERPIKRLLVYALLRGHSGTAWFDDFTVAPLAGPGIFDNQPLAAPRLPRGARSGWFVRDVAAGRGLLALRPGGGAAGITLSGVTTERQGRILRAALRGDGRQRRAVTLYYVERFDASRPVWWKNVRARERLTDTEGTNAVGVGDVGATGTHTRYPFGCVTGERTGRALALPPDLGPRIARIGYHPAARLLYVAFDLALLPERGAAGVAVARYDVSPEWGFRDAAGGYFALFPAFYERRTKAEGIWIPFTDPSRIENVADFGIAWHEGDNSVAGDDRLGILSFRYAEPMSFWMGMPPEEKRDYDTAFARLQRLAAGSSPEASRRQAQATLLSGSRDASGRFNVRFENAPWANGAVWTLNPNPRLPHGPGQWTKARVNYDLADAARRYNKNAPGVLDGEYLDSLEGWAGVLDYGARSLRWSAAPPTFAAESFSPVVPTWFSVWEYTAWLRADLRKRGKLLMGNGTPWGHYAFVPLLDAAGTETNWRGGDGAWRPESDAAMCWRRTLSGRKPYLLLMNTDFDRMRPAEVESYFRRCLFYGIFPSFFSVNAADRPYWENPGWYNRDRALFRKYIPVIRRLSAAGWEPVTHARSDRPEVYLERFGREYLTLLNASKKPIPVAVTLDPASFSGGKRQDRMTVLDVLAATILRQKAAGDRRIVVTLTLGPEEVRVLRLASRGYLTPLPPSCAYLTPPAPFPASFASAHREGGANNAALASGVGGFPEGEKETLGAKHSERRCISSPFPVSASERSREGGRGG